MTSDMANSFQSGVIGAKSDAGRWLADRLAMKAARVLDAALDQWIGLFQLVTDANCAGELDAIAAPPGQVVVPGPWLEILGQLLKLAEVDENELDNLPDRGDNLAHAGAFRRAVEDARAALSPSDELTPALRKLGDEAVESYRRGEAEDLVEPCPPARCHRTPGV